MTAKALIGKIIMSGDKEKAKNYFDNTMIESAAREYFKREKQVI